jgi:type IV pilus assembly protein PilC
MLNYLAKYLKKSARQKHQIVKILLYPSLVLLVTLIVTYILLIFVVPQFKVMFANFAVTLPFYTQVIIRLAELVKTYGALVAISVGSMIFVVFWSRRWQKPRIIIDNVLLALPVVGELIKKNIILRISRILAISLKSNLPILQALTLTAETAGNDLYQIALQMIQVQVANGKPLHLAMRSQNLFTDRVVQLVALGEESGSIDIMFSKIVDQYEHELNIIVESLNSLLEPIIIIILGIVVGGLIVGMYLPIFSLGMAI